jgi:signal transduction histidine kinase
LATSSGVRFEIQDEGPGLTDEDKQKLFGFFQRLSARPTGGESSHGVGLAITKRVVDLHNGKIWAESELGKGTTFIVELPRNTDMPLAA